MCSPGRLSDPIHVYCIVLYTQYCTLLEFKPCGNFCNRKQVLGNKNSWKTGVGERNCMENRCWGAKIHGKQVLGSEKAWKTAVGEQKFNRTCLLLKV